MNEIPSLLQKESILIKIYIKIFLKVQDRVGMYICHFSENKIGITDTNYH